MEWWGQVVQSSPSQSVGQGSWGSPEAFGRSKKLKKMFCNNTEKLFAFFFFYYCSVLVYNGVFQRQYDM